MKCQILFSEKNKKNISKCRLLKILPRVLSVKIYVYVLYRVPIFCAYFMKCSWRIRLLDVCLLNEVVLNKCVSTCIYFTLFYSFLTFTMGKFSR